MADLHRVSRRLFLTDLGKTMAVAVVGTSVLAACGSDGRVVAEAAVDPATTTVPQSTASADQADAVPTDQAIEGTGNDGVFRWQRVNLGFVSAYVLARGNTVAIVDTGVSGSLEQIAGGLDALGASWSDVSDVVLTHLHGDHVGSLPPVLGAASSATAWAGAADAALITGGRDIEPLDDGDNVFGLEVIATPGHTPGHICVLDPDIGFLVAGDALNEDAGMVLGPNPSFTSDMESANASVQRLAAREYETVVFGHGEPILTNASDAVVALAQTL